MKATQLNGIFAVVLLETLVKGLRIIRLLEKAFGKSLIFSRLIELNVSLFLIIHQHVAYKLLADNKSRLKFPTLILTY